MKKYIISGIIGFLINTIWMIGGGYIYAQFDINSPLINILKFYIDVFEKNNDLVGFLYSFFIAIIFAGIVRVILIKITKYNSKEKWLLSLSSGIGFIAAFLGLIYVLWRMFANFSF